MKPYLGCSFFMIFSCLLVRNIDTRTFSTAPHFHTGNMYCGAVLTVLVSIFLTTKKTKNMKKQHPQLGFTFITSLDVVLLMVEFH